MKKKMMCNRFSEDFINLIETIHTKTTIPKSTIIETLTLKGAKDQTHPLFSEMQKIITIMEKQRVRSLLLTIPKDTLSETLLPSRFKNHLKTLILAEASSDDIKKWIKESFDVYAKTCDDPDKIIKSCIKEIRKCLPYNSNQYKKLIGGYENE